MFANRSRTTLLALAAAVGVTACADAPTTTALRPTEQAPLALELSSADAAAGSRVAVAVALDVMPGTTGGIQGALDFDASRLRYIGQSPVGDAITIVNDQAAAQGELRFTSFNPAGIDGRVALFVFETKGAGYAATLRYEHQAAAGANGDLRRVPVQVRRDARVNRGLAVPADARALSVADWAALVGPRGTGTTPIALRPGEYRTNLAYGDIDYDASIGLFDYLGVANAAVGNDQIIVGTDGPAVDVDLVIAGNVFPDNGNGACGREADGSRVLDLFDYLAIANEAVGFNEACVGDVIPGRGPAVTTRQSITATSTPDLIVASGETLTLTKDRVWQVEGILTVQDGGILNIEAGTRIEGLTNAAVTQAVFVERGGQIFANGTVNEPIVFTCTAEPKFKGCWGGVFIAGRGTVNFGDATLGPSPDGCNQRRGEGNAPLYGGCVPTDNSGVLRYVRVEYGGRIIGSDNELNNLTLAGVGSGTVVEYVQAHGGSDDGIEFFGGDLSTRYLVATGNDDDQFDVSFGLRGDHQFVITQSDVGAANNDSKAIEADGNEPAPGTSAAIPRTSPRLWNFTIIGNLAAPTQNAAVHLRRGSGLRLYNSLIAGYTIGFDFDDALTCDATYGDGPIQIRSVTMVDVSNLGNNDASDPLCGTATSTTEGEEEFFNAEPSNRIRTGIASVLVNAFDTNLPDWRMLLVGGQPAEAGTVNPSTVAGSAAVATNYRGAVAPVNTAGDIPWYSGWTRPFQAATAP